MSQRRHSRTWKKINSVTISFGHGVATTPLQTAVCGRISYQWRQPHFADLPTTVAGTGRSIVAKRHQAKHERGYALPLHLEQAEGLGRGAQVEGFNVGGKTGTADKVINGRYASDLNFNAFVAAFPMDKPKYMVLSIIDAPRKPASTAGELQRQPLLRW